mgnify:CR=1 FL=1
MAGEELFDGIGEIDVGSNYIESESETDLIDVPEDGSNPESDNNGEKQGEGQDGNQKEQGTDESETRQKDESGKVPKEIQELIDTNNIETEESEDEGEGEKEAEEDTEDTKDSGEEEPPDSPDDDDNSDDDSSPSASVDPYIAFGNTLKEGGSFSTFDEEEFKKLAEEKGDPEAAFVEMQQNELEKAKEEYINSLTEEDKQLYEAKEAGVNLNEMGQIDKTLKSYNNISDEFLDEEDNSETAKAITKEYLRLKGFEDDEINENLELYEENGTLSKWSKKARNKIVESLKGQKQQLVEDQKEQKKQEQQEIEQRKQKLKQTVNSYDEIIPGVKLNDNVKQEVYKDMTTPVAEDDQGNPLDAVGHTRSKNPEAFDAAIYYYNRLGLFNIDENGNLNPDFSKIKKATQTKEAQRLGKVLGQQGNENFKPKGKKKKAEKETENLFDGL